MYKAGNLDTYFSRKIGRATDGSVGLNQQHYIQQICVAHFHVDLKPGH